MFKCCVQTSASKGEIEVDTGLEAGDKTIRAVRDKKIRTASSTPLTAEAALHELKAGNRRFVDNCSERLSRPFELRRELAHNGQNPMAVVIGCADSRCPVEIAFDAQPGDIFVLRNAGNACPCGEGSIVGSTEYAVGALKTKLVVVMGHTKCGAIVGATNLVVKTQAQAKAPSERSALDQYLADLTPAAEQAVKNVKKDASVDEIAKEAIHLNVFRTIEKLLSHSRSLRDAVSSGEVQMQGAVYDIESGEVMFKGPHPNQKALLEGAKTGISEKAMGS